VVAVVVTAVVVTAVGKGVVVVAVVVAVVGVLNAQPHMHQGSTVLVKHTQAVSKGVRSTSKRTGRKRHTHTGAATHTSALPLPLPLSAAECSAWRATTSSRSAVTFSEALAMLASCVLGTLR
jgi:hypothetical protein